MDRNHYRNRTRDLRARAEQLDQLVKMPDRVTSYDLRLASDLMTEAANDLDKLIKATPPGCTCHLVESDTHSYLDYAEDCLHHRDLYTRRENLKGSFAKMERTLKNEVRVRFIMAALSGVAARPNVDASGTLANYAISIADEALRQIVEDAK